MWIERIKLNNFRIYQGSTEVIFTKSESRNISLIAGKNGFGKTSFLTSLIWGLYGSLMAQVEEKYKRDIRSSGGYDSFVETLINNTEKRRFARGETSHVKVEVEIHLMDVMIPSIPCRKVIIRRSYDLSDKKESLSILIDGHENELTKQVGYEVFINDFILPREIAKFFFFDAEKIVTLAEARTKQELRSLSKAYSEVLGIKKYEDLKENLSTLLTKLKRGGALNVSQERLAELEKNEKDINSLIERNKENRKSLEEDIARDKSRIDKIQEQLIREGNEMTLEELKDLKKVRDQLKKQLNEIKGEMKKFMDIIPLVIAKKRFNELVEQIELEFRLKKAGASKEDLKKELLQLGSSFKKEVKSQLPDAETLDKVVKAFQETAAKQLEKRSSVDGEILLDFDDARARAVLATHRYVNDSFPKQFKSVKKREKDVLTHLNRVLKKIKQGEARKDNPLAQKLREDKAEIQQRIDKNEARLMEIVQEAAELNIRFASNHKVLSEIEKNFKLNETDQKKYKVTSDLLVKLQELTAKIKEEKKYALQKAILLGLKKLMHKSTFIADVRVRIEDEIMDIDLIDSSGSIIDKDNLSKGEQQLYATSLLKALVDESGINFPVFIDSPLQKFDKQHSSNVIKQFYPYISEQVVLFPLLEKELSQKEFELLEPNLSSVHLIDNSEHGSTINPCKISELFTLFNKQHVHAY